MSSMDFEGKHIPLELSEKEVNQKEFQDLKAFFSMGKEGGEIQGGLFSAVKAATAAFTDLSVSKRSNAAAGAGEGPDPAESINVYAQQWRAQNQLRKTLRSQIGDAEPTLTPLTPTADASQMAATARPAEGFGKASSSSAQRPATVDGRGRPQTTRSHMGSTDGLAPWRPAGAPFRPAKSPRMNSASPLRSTAGEGLPGSRNDDGGSIGGTSIFVPEPAPHADEAHQRLHRPVTPRELVQATAPVPISINPLFKRRGESKKQETHYDYFTRKIPGESPKYREVMQWRASTTRKVFNYGTAGAETSQSWASPRRARDSSRDSGAQDGSQSPARRGNEGGSPHPPQPPQGGQRGGPRPGGRRAAQAPQSARATAASDKRQGRGPGLPPVS
jgi:hypothetical protein